MAIKITEDGVVIYENEPDVERELFPNIPLSGGTPEQITQAVNTWLEEHPEATTTVEDGSITKPKLDSNLQTELDSMDSEIGELKENLETLVTVTTKETPETETVPLSFTWTSGYTGLNGATGSNANLQYTNHISVQGGDVIKIYRESDGAPITGTARFVTAFSNGVAIQSKGLENASNPFTVPPDVDEIVITIAYAYGNATGDKTSTVVTLAPVVSEQDIEDLYDITASKKPNRLLYTFDLSANGTYNATENVQDMCGYRICFDAKISDFNGETKICKAIGQTYGGGIGFDGTNLYQYFSTNINPVRTQAHGLTLKDYVSITIDANYYLTAKVTISTNGGRYEWELPYWRIYYGALSVSTVSALTDCSLSYACEGLKKDIWIFGDSYLEHASNTRWTYYLTRSGHTNYLLNGYPGRTSDFAQTALQTALSMNYIPRKIIWGLGMNDKDSLSEPNHNWKTAIDALIAICEKYNIELILSTIPNTPAINVNNLQKNAWVVNSGYRYIDFANAVSADGSSTWYDGMLNADNVHPNEQGAIALYECAVTEVPELLL